MSKEMTLQEYKAKYELTNLELGQMMGVSHKAVSQFLNSPSIILVKKVKGQLLHNHCSGYRFGTYKALSAKRKKEAAKQKKKARA